MFAFAPLQSASKATARNVSAGAFLKKKTSTQNSSTPKMVAKKGKLVTAGEDIKAQQFSLRLGKNLTIPITLGFTKSNELFVGRMAMIGFAASVIGEVISGKGALAQFDIETGLPLTEIDGIVAAIVIFNLIAALLPARGKLVLPEDEFEERPDGPLQNPSISILQPKKFFGISGFGFTKENELFVGRMAQLGFAASLVGEWTTGLGPLHQLGLETGIPLNEAEPLLLFSIVFTLFAAINEGRGKFVDE